MKTNFLYVLTILIFIAMETSGQDNLLPRFHQSQQNEHATANITKLVIHNKHGKIYYTSWDRDIISVNVNIWAEAPILPTASEVFNNISITNHQNANEYQYHTRIDPRFVALYNFGIDYQIQGPSDLILSINNSFGDIDITEFNGSVDIHLEYGDLNMRHNSQVQHGNIYVSNGNIHLNQVSEGTITHRNGLLEIQTVGSLNLNTDFVEANIHQVNDLDFLFKTGKMKINRVGKIKGESFFTNIHINEINQNGFIEMEEGQLLINNLHNNVDELTVAANKAPVELIISGDLSHTLHGQIENGEFIHSDSDRIRVIKESNKTSFSGRVINHESDKVTSLILIGKDGHIKVTVK